MTASTESAPPSSPAHASAAPRRHWPKPIWSLIVLCRFLSGYRHYLRTGDTSAEAYADMRRLFRLTNGRFNDVAARFASVWHPRRRLDSRAGILGNMSGPHGRQALRTLRREGMYRFEPMLPLEQCERLIALASRAPCEPVPAPSGISRPVRFDPRHPIATRYTVDPQTLHESPEVQAIVTDRSVLALAQAYLACQPALVSCDMWWSAAFSGRPCHESAQLFHFDMSQIRFLKVFMYLTDVDERTGPHVFVPRSHRRIPGALREDRRYQDEEVARHFPPSRWVTLTGPHGTIFAEDTRGFHKGLPLLERHRLILQLNFATSRFGEAHPGIRLSDRFTHEFRATRARYPFTYAQFIET